MIDLHPPISGLPLASVLFLCISELLVLTPVLRSSRDTLRSAAVTSCIVSVIAAFATGYQASSSATELLPSAEIAMADHHSFGKALLVSALLLGTFYYVARIATHGKKAFYYLYYLVLLVQVIGTIWVGFLGGRLVFKHGVNVSCIEQRALQ